MESDSIPELPPVGVQTDLVTQALSSSAALKAVEQQARAKDFEAQGEHKQLYPSVDAAAQYGVFSKFNNYDQFFSKFQRNNATIGLGIRLPILNYAQRAQADAADADALQARRQVELTRNQISTQTIQLAQAVQQLTAAEQVSQLEYQVAQSQVEATQTRAAGTAPAGPSAAPATPQDLENARIEAGQRYSAYLDATFELQKTQLQLLRVTGELERWATGTP